MLCTSCTLKKICTVYSTKKEHEDAITISITNCEYKTNINQVKPDQVSITDSDILLGQFDEEEYKKFLDRQKGIIAENKSEIMTCPTCGGQDYSDYITICSKCGREVCGNCGTNDEGLTYCSKCWEEI